MANERDDQEEDREERPEDEETHQVDLEAGGEEEGEGEGGEEETAETQRQTRAERRAERGRLKQERDELRNQNRELSERMARMEGQLEASIRDTRERGERATETDDPLQAEYDEVLEQQEALAERITALGDKMTPAQEAKFRDQARKLDIRKHELAAERVARRTAPRPDPNANTRRGLEVAYSDVYADDAARNYAKAEFMRLINHPNAALRQPNSLATVKLALENTRKEFGMSRAAPSETERARTSGVSRGGTGGGAGRTSVVQMGKFEKGLADKAFPHIKNDKERYDKWAKTAGKKMLERKAQRAAGSKR